MDTMEMNTMMDAVETVTETMTGCAADIATAIPTETVTNTANTAADFVRNYNFEPEKVYIPMPADGSANFGSFVCGAAAMGAGILVIAGIRKLKKEYDLKTAKKAQQAKTVEHPGTADETVEPEFQREAPKTEGEEQTVEPEKTQTVDEQKK